MTSPQAPSRVTSTPVSPGQSPSRHLSNALNRPSNALLDENVDVAEHELVSLQHSGYIPVAIPAQSHSTFKREDYNAPTTWFDPVKQQGQLLADVRSKPGKTPASGKRRSLLPLLSAITAILLLAVIGTGYYTYQAVTATSVNVNISPQAHVINQIYTIKVDPTIQNANLDTQSIPARPLNSNDQSSMKGPTTGQVNCTFGFFGCQRGVSQDDVDSLVSQIQPQLEQEITRELENKTISVSGKAVSPINFQTLSITSNPAVGEQGKTVTVTVQEQGSIGYILTNDVVHMAQQLVTRQAQAVRAELSATSLIDHDRGASYRRSRFWFHRYQNCCWWYRTIPISIIRTAGDTGWIERQNTKGCSKLPCAPPGRRPQYNNHSFHKREEQYTSRRPTTN